MAKDRPPSYTPAPELPTDPELRRRFGEIVAVLAQTQTVTGAAQALGLSRNHFQTILHRVIAAMIDEITPKPAGRPARPEREVALEAENTKLRDTLAAMTERTEAIERMLKVVGGFASGKTPLPRSRSKKTESEDPEPAPMTRRDAVKAMREQQVPVALCAAALGRSPSTIRRDRHDRPRRERVTRPIDAATRQRVQTIVRRTHGLVGAQHLSRQCHLPRRTCAAIKKRELREMEHERRTRCTRVTIVAPRLVRGFDAMYVAATEGMAYWLVAADAAVPYRTSVTTTRTYDATGVIEALRVDFETHGAPLVMRLDRIACQRTPEVLRFLDEWEVLPLHGPPRHPGYYGQLERQNREHRACAWYNQLPLISVRELSAAAHEMRTALNTLWPRPSLDGWTAEQAWRARTTVDVDRRVLRRDVDYHTEWLVSLGHDQLYSRRIAIESALQERGLLVTNPGGWR